MRIANPMDGMYFFLLFVPFVLSIWAGDILRKKILFHILSDHSLNQNLSLFIGVSVQVLVMIIGTSAGFILTRLF